MGGYEHTLWTLFLPVISFVLLGLFGRKYFSKSAGLIGVFLLLLTTALSLYTAYQYFFVNGLVDGIYQKIDAFKFTWLTFSPGVSIDMGIMLDPISVMMLVVVSSVSLMVHIFSLGYMKGEERFATYYSFLGLFTFAMLGLVVSSNLFQMYMFWELVGISSYLLIGFHFQRPSAVAASKKAFIVTRFADLGFLIGILMLAFYGGSLDFNTIIQHLSAQQSSAYLAATTASFLGVTALTWGLTLVFMGGAGKSAMFPLHVWLPDAMEGPTPVSALIHAATMVVAGVYLVARLFPLYALNGASLEIVLNVGLFTALFAAIIACTQTDIKRVLAYSTMSQIGFMMFALGVSGTQGEQGLGYTASMFHLFTHAFFKSLLFLGAGAVIHFVHSNEMKDMGGLRKWMPLTHLAFLIACLAIAGIPPFAGFFSKEEILLATYNKSIWVYAIALITSGLTAFYMFRLYFSIFWRKEYNGHSHPHEGTMSMKIPLIILAVCSALVGLIPFGKFVSVGNQPQETHFHLMFSILPIIIGVAGILIALLMYKKENDRPQNMAQAFGNFYRAAKNRFYMDELYLFVTKNIIFKWVGRPSAWFDRKVVDGSMDEIANLTLETSKAIKGLQSGKVQRYAMYFFGGIAFLIILFVYILK
ncbi:MAG TPA: NADH-quinone oxidoreductase subunit L [Niabella sp.]|jgi:NADH-quinone oxidoreductase subunit L|nr:NADH-quinone oxidoreductase subunit L [Niabella sp.]HRO84624.1 NADH-quinone oxidoreductase subunit L [Niabella sp.]